MNKSEAANWITQDLGLTIAVLQQIIEHLQAL